MSGVGRFVRANRLTRAGSAARHVNIKLEARGNKGSVGHKLLANAEIPRLQRCISAPSLAQFAAMPEHDMAIVQAYATGCYSMKEIAETLDIQYAIASRTEKKTD